MTQMGYCGTDCGKCDIGAKTGCPGCRAAAGKLFWGTCALAQCCIPKGHQHCGKCQEFVCDKLKAYAFDKEHGDNGRRIENLRAALRREDPQQA